MLEDFFVNQEDANDANDTKKYREQRLNIMSRLLSPQPKIVFKPYCINR